MPHKSRFSPWLVVAGLVGVNAVLSIGILFGLMATDPHTAASQPVIAPSPAAGTEVKSSRVEEQPRQPVRSPTPPAERGTAEPQQQPPAAKPLPQSTRTKKGPEIATLRTDKSIRFDVEGGSLSMDKGGVRLKTPFGDFSFDL